MEPPPLDPTRQPPSGASVVLEGLRYRYALIAPRTGRETPTQTPPARVGVGFTAHPRLVAVHDGTARRLDAPAGAAYLTTESAIEWVEVYGPTEAIEIELDPDTVAAARADHAVPAFAADDPVIFAAATRLRAAHLASTSLADVESSTLAHRLGRHIAHRYAGVRDHDARVRRLTARELATVHRFVADNVGSTLTLDRLAAALHRSVFDFARAFRASAGVPPHQYVTMLRMNHALQQLRSGATVAATAAAVGYDSRYHFRQQFRSATGLDCAAVAEKIEQERSRAVAVIPRTLEA